jgi:membrane protein YdbS with pleckstrin-like domain
MSDAPLERLPAATLDRRVVTLWRITDAIGWGIAGMAALIGGAIAWAYDVPAVLIVLALGVLGALAVADLVILPPLRWRSWRYEIGLLEVDLAFGIWTRTRAKVPMARIQHVDTRQGPIERQFGLSTVILSTAAGAHAIPGLAAPTAAAVRDRVAELANTRDDV